MNKWSTSLPSMISLCNDVQFNFDPMIMQQSTTLTTPTPSSSSSQNRNLHSTGGSLTDLSILIQTQSPFTNYDQYSNNNYSQSIKQSPSFYDTSIDNETAVKTDISSHEQFVPDDELLQSLVAYADSFELDSSVYSIQNTKHQPTITTTSISTGRTPLRRRTQSSVTHLTSIIENDLLTRHKSCDDISVAGSISNSSKPTTVIPREEHRIKDNTTKFVPSESHPQFFFATKTHGEKKKYRVQKKHKDKLIKDGTTTTIDESKVEWGFSSDTIAEFNKPSTELFNNYEATTNIADINLNYLKDLEYFSSMAASMDFPSEISTAIPHPPPPPLPPPPPPVIIRKKSKDFLLKQQVDIQLLRPPTPPTPAPIIIREIRHKPPISNRPITIHQKLENTSQIRVSKTPSPIVFRERPPLPPKQEFSSKPTIVYRHLPTPPPSPPTVIVERLRPHLSAVIQKPPPILVEKWLPYPPEQKRQIIYERASPLPTRNDDQGKKIIFEYDKVNVIVNKDIKQRKEIKRVSPNQYVKQYGNSLYSNETLNQLLTCASQVKKNEHPILPHQYHYENYAPIFH